MLPKPTQLAIDTEKLLSVPKRKYGLVTTPAIATPPASNLNTRTVAQRKWSAPPRIGGFRRKR